MQNYSLITLGELLSSENKIIRNNAISVLKQLQKQENCDGEIDNQGYCKNCKGNFKNCDRCGLIISDLDYANGSGLCNNCK